MDASGVGMKEASVVTLPAFIASRIASRPLVEEMCRHTEDAGIGTVQRCMVAYDQRTTAAANRWAATFPTGVHGQARLLIGAASASAAMRWRGCCEGDEGEPEEREAPQRAQGSRSPAALLCQMKALRTEIAPRRHTTLAHQGPEQPRAYRGRMRSPRTLGQGDPVRRLRPR